jgi:DNA-binding PadR family transcriptional regulator
MPSRPLRDADVEMLLPLKPAAFLLLLSLADGERHGYALRQDVLRRTDGKVRLGPATLYRTLQWLVDRSLIEESDERPDPDLDDERRRYYRLTPLGRRVAAAEAARLATLVRAARDSHLLGRFKP